MFALCCLKFSKTMTKSPTKYHSRNTSIFRRGVKFFFQRNLLLTNSITSGGFMAIGDIVQQEFQYQSKLIQERYDWARVGRMFIIGTLMGPMHHYYYIHLDRVLPKTNAKTILTKVLCDQLVASPLTILFFFYGMGALEHKTFSECNKEILQKFKYVMMGDWLFWPPVQIVNFYYLPTHYRVIYINLATMVFNVFMSYMKHYDQLKPKIDG